MFELFIARKYLVPRRKQISVSLIALMSVAVIALVVWLVLLFLSVTEGIEKSWLKKLTSLNSPIRITPTNYYYSSYYYHIDTISSSSGYTHKSLKEKLASETSDPYLSEEDEEIPSFWPKPDLDAHGNLKDPVKALFRSLETMKKKHPSLLAEDYEVTGALMKLRLIRPTSTLSSQLDQQSFLTQMTYVASFSEKSPFLHSLLLPPSTEDIHHLIYLASLSAEDTSLDLPHEITRSSYELFQKRLQPICAYLGTMHFTPLRSYVELPIDSLQEGASLQAIAHSAHGRITHICLPTTLSKKLLHDSQKRSQHLVYGTLHKKEGHLFFSTQRDSFLVDTIPLHSDDKLHLVGEIRRESLNSARNIQELFATVEAHLQNISIKASLPLHQLRITKASPIQHFENSPLTLPLWPYFTKNSCSLPVTLSHEDHGVILPKHFKDSGVCIGDKGFLSYGVATASAMQEQRLPIYVAGFYDPGIMAVGAKCILMQGDIVHNIAMSSSSFTLDETMSSGIQVWFADLEQTQAIAASLAQLLKQEGIDRYFDITPFYEYDFAKDLLQQFQSDKYLFTLVGVIILIVACSNIISFLVLMVSDKKKEIGILQAMGASSTSIAMIFALCGAAVGLLGSVLGSLAAYLTMHNISSLVNLLSLIQGRSAFHESFYGSTLPSALSSEAVLFILISTPILSVLAGLVPAIKACRCNPARTLRSE